MGRRGIGRPDPRQDRARRERPEPDPEPHERQRQRRPAGDGERRRDRRPERDRGRVLHRRRTPATATGAAITIPPRRRSSASRRRSRPRPSAALADGAHTVTVRAQDAVGNWGAIARPTLIVDKTGPTTRSVSATPNPTNGLFGVQIGSTGQLYERIDATITDPVAGGVSSTIVAAEYFIDTVGANGTGGGMLAADGVFNSSTEGASWARQSSSGSRPSRGLPHDLRPRQGRGRQLGRDVQHHAGRRPDAAVHHLGRADPEPDRRRRRP